MGQVVAKIETVRTNLIMTNKAREGILAWSKDEHAFFHLQKSFLVHIERMSNSAQGETAITIYFDNEANTTLAKKLDSRVAVMNCIVKYEGLLATNFRVISARVPVRTNRRYATKLEFVTAHKNTVGMPIELHSKIRELPIAEERTEYVRKRISSWEGYLKIQERDATIEDMTASFSKFTVNEDFSRMTLNCSGLKDNEWNKAKGLSAKFKGSRDELGEVLKVNRGNKTVEIELRPYIRERLRKNQLKPKTKEVVFSNFATLSQIRRLRKGFADLEKGLAANANLEKILFEDRPRIQAPKRRAKLDFHNQLNEFQQEAVTGAMSAEDLYVIQGPPGTGKTTVISEICQQNAKAGLRTLVASQSNLAVDNALSRLLSNKDIRILRFGRTESIEEEGKKFIEENVAQYWKDQTLRDLEQELEKHADQETKLTATLATGEKELQTLEAQLLFIKEKLVEQQQAKVDYKVINEDIQKLKKTLGALRRELRELEENFGDVANKYEHVLKKVEELERFLEANDSSEQLLEQFNRIVKEIEQTRNQLLYRQVEEELNSVNEALSVSRTEYISWQRNVLELHQLQHNLEHFTKVDELTSFMQQYEIPMGFIIERQLDAFEKIKNQMVSYHDWMALNNKLKAAIDYVEKKMGPAAQIILQQVNSRPADSYSSYSIREVHEAIDQMKQFLLTEKVVNPEQLKRHLERLYFRRKFVWEQGVVLQQLKQEAIRVFEMIKKEVAKQTTQVLTTAQQKKSTLTNKGMLLKNKQALVQERYDQLKSKRSEDVTSGNREQLKAILHKLEAEAQHIKTIHQAVLQKIPQLAQMQQQHQMLTEQRTVTANQIEEKKQAMKEVNSQGLQQEKDLKALEEILEQDFQDQQLQIDYAIKKLSEKITKLQHNKIQLPIKQALQNQWYTLLQEANEHDLDEIRKLYVRHANVIGTTCVASARKEFMENYPTFDVVIIDEVSKATPPELLLPMLKGKKVILVGDHHQLPPLVGDDTLEETLKAIIEESDTIEESAELKKLLKESLFERLFKNLPRDNKQMLAIQYRMHADIMKTITPFYENEDDQLQCGLIDSNNVRDHFLDGHYVKRANHLLWLDIPNKKPYFEEQMKNGKSRFNQGELDTIRHMLLDLEHTTEMAKASGDMQPNELKSVGVISFYGEQVKKIDRLLQQELHLKHLHLRTGTVDKFQGMEMDVIIVSMVRNTQNRSGDIGFANDYRRLNVALSRARELLILVGSTEMFTQRAKHKNARDMYSQLLETVKEQNGLRDQDGNVK
ncbi:AAA family ATPase [Viridibacillus sp. YIM B01967]|uniref:AAA family ATPase n=1 Tax=Viridibacillus soli TaxID=2798301 RepID=A0ABS1HC10_9BACL|nr:AAA domain-containing protein [Viridibacillus soli]MBK3496948.1 AAA family ATPase [Viridibacillus soli]